nr:hypothetical protein [Nostoc sp. EkiNYC01]
SAWLSYLLDAGHLLYNGFQTIIFSWFGVLHASLCFASLQALIQYSEPILMCQLFFQNFLEIIFQSAETAHYVGL